MSRFTKNGHVVDASAARTHIARLSAEGFGHRRVAKVSHVAERTLKGIKNGRRPRIRRSTELRILGVTIS